MRTFITFMIGLAVALGAGGCGNLQEEGPLGIAYTPAGDLVVFLHGQVRFFDPEARLQFASVDTGAQGIEGWIPIGSHYAVSAGGATLAVAAHRNVEIYDVRNRQRLATIVISDDTAELEHAPIAGISLSGDGSLVAVSVRSIYANGTPPDGYARGTTRLAVWRVSDQSLITEIAPAPELPANDSSWSAGIAFSADAKSLYGVSQSTTAAYLTAWSLPDGGVVWQSAVPPAVGPAVDPQDPAPPAVAWVDALALSADGAWLATAGQKINLWRAADGAHQDQFQMDPLRVRLGSVMFAPDGQSLATTHFTNSLPDPQVFGLDGSLIRGFPIEDSGCAAAAFSPDGTRIAAACEPWVKIWDAQTGEQIQNVRVTAPIY